MAEKEMKEVKAKAPAAKGEKRMKAAEAKRILPTHGRTFTGVVVSDKMSRTVTVAWERRHYVPKYQRYERRYSTVKAHNPDAIDAKAGDTVTIMETRPISKTKSFIIIKKHAAGEQKNVAGTSVAAGVQGAEHASKQTE